jgi:hypothetical protein
MAAVKQALMSDPSTNVTGAVLDLLAERADPEKGKAEALAEIDRLGLADYVAELDTNGYAIIPPDKVAPPEFIDRMLNAVLDVTERRWGTRPDMGNPDADGFSAPHGTSVTYMLFEDPVFQEAALNPTALALATYLVGHNAMLYTCMALLKGPGRIDMPLHSDNIMVPPPFGPNYLVCNTTWLLTDASPENGSTCFVPGSHKMQRHPHPGEATADRVAITAPRGSLLVWPGHTWHGGVARINEGLRVQMPIMYGRMFVRPQEAYMENFTQEMLDRNPPRFAKLVGQHVPYGFKEEGPDIAKFVGLPKHSAWE